MRFTYSLKVTSTYHTINAAITIFFAVKLFFSQRFTVRLVFLELVCSFYGIFFYLAGRSSCRIMCILVIVVVDEVRTQSVRRMQCDSDTVLAL